MAKTKSYLKYIFIAGLIFGLFFGIGSGLSHILYVDRDADPVEEEETADKVKEGKRTKILVLGVDARPGEKKSRSDTMILVTIDPQLDKAAIVSIPRDTRVELKGGAVDKICAVNYLGGPKYAVEVVEKLMDTKIDYYVEMDFKGFKEIIDTLGGVTINVPQRMYKPTEDIDLYPGTQKLNGRQALGFVRFRDYNMGDIQRTAAQQEFLKALAGEILKPKTLTKLPTLVRQLDKYMDTDLKKSDMLRLASWAPGFTAESITAQTLPGYFYDLCDEYGNLTCSYWIADKKKLSGLLDHMLSGETVAVIQSSPYTQKKEVAAKNDSSSDENENEGIPRDI
ncbi:MAG: LCP family protein, partial [Syntrophomonas sp.]|nr:LCP family protein [Syntrophomonas sp.]